MEQEFTYENIPLGSTVTYLAKGGIVKEGRVIRKQEKLPMYWSAVKALRTEVAKTILVIGKGEYGDSLVNLRQFKNVRSVVV